MDLSRALEGAARTAEARQALEALVARLPDEPSAHAQLGKLLHRLGEREAALVELRRALELRPQDPELRRYTERAAVVRDEDAGAPREDLARRYAADVAAMVVGKPLPASARTGAPPSPAPADPAIVWLDRRVVRVHRNGLAETFAQRVVEVETDRGAEDNKQFYVRYTPGVEEVEIRQARIFRRGADGQVQILDASERDDEDLSEPWYGLYYDNRAEVVRFEGLRAGDVLEVQYLIDDVSTKNQLADYFGDLQFIAEDVPKKQWDYTLIGPTDRAFYTNTPHLPRLEQQTSEEGGDQVRRFAARDVDKISSEPAQPGYTEVAPYLHVSTYASWRDVGAWYWRLVEEQMVPDDSIRKAARSVLEPAMTDIEKVRAIHGLVVTGTRYVGLEFGIHGFQPYKVTQVLARKFGDCKDKATLMIALLREAGIDAELVLLRTRRGGRIEPAAGVAGRVRSRHRVRAKARRLPRRHGGVLRRGGAAEPGPGRHRAARRAARLDADRDAGAAIVAEPRGPALDRRCCRRAARPASASGSRSPARPRPNGASTTRRRASGSIATPRCGTAAIRARRCRVSTCRRSRIAINRSRSTRSRRCRGSGRSWRGPPTEPRRRSTWRSPCATPTSRAPTRASPSARRT